MNIKIALSSDVLDAIEKLPKAQRGKVRRFITDFQKNPAAPGYNFETINDAADKRMRSVRIDQTYRAILLKPEKGNIYLLVWVDHHDEAYDWATRKRIAINPETGGIQVFSATQVDTVAPSPEEADVALFAALRDRELVRLGVPEEQVELVRSFRSQTDLFDHEEALPKDAIEALFYFADGESYDDVVRSQDREKEEAAIDLADFEAALNRPESRRQFVIADDALLEEMLNAPLEKWRVFLHPSQHRVVRMNANGPVRVLGGAGTGKTVVAMHRAKRLASEIFTGETDRILFTTYTKNLVEDIRANLRLICDDETFARIEIINFDQWASNFLRKAGVNYQLAYGKSVDESWQNVFSEVSHDTSYPNSFIREEFEAIILGHGIETKDEYLQVSRIGRGRALNRRDRFDLWPIFEQYREELRQRGFREPQDAFRHARQLLSDGRHHLPYRAVVVDEAQDMSAEALRLIRAIVPEGAHDLFIVGDAHQRIYGKPIVFSHCGIDIRGRGRRLRVNYRTPEEVRNWAVGILKGMPVDDMDGGSDTMRGYRSLLHGEKPAIHVFESFSSEVQFIKARIQELVDSGANLNRMCLVARTHNALNQYEGALKALDVETYAIHRSAADDRSKPGIRMATMHRVKGIEFDHVIIAGVNDGVLPLTAAVDPYEDFAERRDAENRERSLLYVAATRPKKTLSVTCYGEPSSFLFQLG